MTDCAPSLIVISFAVELRQNNRYFRVSARKKETLLPLSRSLPQIGLALCLEFGRLGFRCCASNLRCCLLLLLIARNKWRGVFVFARKKGFVVCYCRSMLCAPSVAVCYCWASLIISWRLLDDLLCFAVCDLLPSDISSAILLSLLIFILLLRYLSSAIYQLSIRQFSIYQLYLIIMF